MPSIVITGAASGIGRATAKLFYKNGWTVGLADINEVELVALQKTMDNKRSCILLMDVADESSVEKAFATFKDFQGNSLDALFNCAGILRMGDNDSISLKDQHQMISVNVNGILNCIYYATPMLKLGHNARIISMSSASAVYGTPQFAVYSASKHAVRGLTEALNIEFEPQSIYVCDLMVPFVDTPMVNEATHQASAVKNLGVNVTPLSVAKTVLRATKNKRVHWQVGVPMYLFSAINWAMPFNRRQLIKKYSE